MLKVRSPGAVVGKGVITGCLDHGELLSDTPAVVDFLLLAVCETFWSKPHYL